MICPKCGKTLNTTKCKCGFSFKGELVTLVGNKNQLVKIINGVEAIKKEKENRKRKGAEVPERRRPEIAEAAEMQDREKNNSELKQIIASRYNNKRQKKIAAKVATYFVVAAVLISGGYFTGKILGSRIYNVFNQNESATLDLTEHQHLASSIELLQAGMDNGDYRQVVFGSDAVYCLNNDGNISVFASSTELSKDLQQKYATWENISSIAIIPKNSGYDENLLAITEGGKVLCPEGARVWQGEIDVSEWKSIIQIDASSSDAVIGLASDGTVYCSPSTRRSDGSPIFYNGLGYLFGCKKIVSLHGKETEVLGLSSSGSVICDSEYVPYFYYRGDWNTTYLGWNDLKDISVCSLHGNLFGLTQSGNLLYGGTCGSMGDELFDDNETTALSALSDVTDIATGGSHIVALKSNGTVFATGNNVYGQCDVDSWVDITRIEVCEQTTIGYGADGKVYYAGYNCLEESLSKLKQDEATI